MESFCVGFRRVRVRVSRISVVLFIIWVQVLIGTRKSRHSARPFTFQMNRDEQCLCETVVSQQVNDITCCLSACVLSLRLKHRQLTMKDKEKVSVPDRLIVGPHTANPNPNPTKPYTE